MQLCDNREYLSSINYSQKQTLFQKQQKRKHRSRMVQQPRQGWVYIYSGKQILPDQQNTQAKTYFKEIKKTLKLLLKNLKNQFDKHLTEFLLCEIKCDVLPGFEIAKGCFELEDCMERCENFAFVSEFNSMSRRFGRYQKLKGFLTFFMRITVFNFSIQSLC